MKHKLAITALFLFQLGTLNAQTVTTTSDGNKRTFVITSTTTKSEILKAENDFKEHNIHATIKAARRNGIITQLNIAVNCTRGKVKYHTNNALNISNGIMITVDDSKKSKVALAVGPINN